MWDNLELNSQEVNINLNCKEKCPHLIFNQYMKNTALYDWYSVSKDSYLACCLQTQRWVPTGVVFKLDLRQFFGKG